MHDEPKLTPYALAVDDDTLILLGVRDSLEQAGFRTLEAHNGDEALEVIAQHEEAIALLFTDVQMPGMNGFELAHEVAARWPEIAIVVASGQITPNLGEMPAGAMFIPKPFSAETVRAHLQEILPEGRKPEPLIQAR